jgi:hypothetical protein
VRHLKPVRRSNEDVTMLGRPLLFLSSYAPLFGLLAIRFTPRWLWISCLVLAVLGVASLYLLLRLDAASSQASHTLVSVRDAGAEAATYLAAYLLPFLTVAEPSVRDILAYAGFLLVAAVINIRSAAVQVNPVLYLLRYRVLSVTWVTDESVTDKKSFHAYMITKHSRYEGDKVKVTRFSDDVLVDRT